MTAQPITQLSAHRDGVVFPAPMVRLLGTLESPGRTLPTAGKARQTLALMLLNADRFVSYGRFIDELWADQPRKALQSLQTYVLHLRGKYTGWDVALQPGGYLLRLAPASVDVSVFDQLADRGRRALERGDVAEADGLLRDALGLWRGEPLADVQHGAVLSGVVAGVKDRLRSTRELRFEVDLRLGRHRQIVDELTAVVRAEPGREDTAAKLMLALYRSQRRVEALQVFDRVRRSLREEFGMDPGHELRLLQRQVLTGDPGLNLDGGAA